MNKNAFEEAHEWRERLTRDGELVLQVSSMAAPMILASIERAQQAGERFKPGFSIKLNALLSDEYARILAFVLWFGPACVAAQIARQSSHPPARDLVLRMRAGAQPLCRQPAPDLSSVRPRL